MNGKVLYWALFSGRSWLQKATETRTVTLLRDWREESWNFLHYDLPKIVLIVVASYVSIWILRIGTRRLANLWMKRLPSATRAQKVRTLSNVIRTAGVALVVFVAATMILSAVGFNPGPLLASAGIAGLAIGFGAQTLVHDVINGFLILLEDQFEIGDTVLIAGVKGTVESMSLLHTVLRDEDGTLHMVPNSQITIVSNRTRDWARLAIRVVVPEHESSDRVISLLKQVGSELRHDPAFADALVADIDVPGIDRFAQNEAEYLVLAKTRPGRQFEVGRELRRQIKECLKKNNIQPSAPGKSFIAADTSQVT
jgi:small conductance mechanosensitive channel